MYLKLLIYLLLSVIIFAAESSNEMLVDVKFTEAAVESSSEMLVDVRFKNASAESSNVMLADFPS